MRFGGDDAWAIAAVAFFTTGHTVAGWVCVAVASIATIASGFK